MRRVIPFLIVQIFALSCTKHVEAENEKKTLFETAVRIEGEAYKGWKDGLACQGCAIRNDTVYITRHGGVCERYLLIGNKLVFLSRFVFKSGNNNNHSNCIQFDSSYPKNVGSVVYISSHFRNEPCIVERITEKGSELVQTIKVEVSRVVPQNMHFNLQAGDDSFLWLCGFFENTLKIIKYNKPALSQKEVILSDNDILEKWERTDYDWEQEVLQGMKVYDGKLYVVYGGSYNKRGVWIWDSNTFEFIRNVDFTSNTLVEFEDCEIYNNHFYLFVLDNYILRFDLDKLLSSC